MRPEGWPAAKPRRPARQPKASPAPRHFSTTPSATRPRPAWRCIRWATPPSCKPRQPRSSPGLKPKGSCAALRTCWIWAAASAGYRRRWLHAAGPCWRLTCRRQWWRRQEHRLADIANIEVRHTEGDGLDWLSPSTFDLVLAVDSFPYIVQASPDLALRHARGATRVLRPCGVFCVLNLSYRGDLQPIGKMQSPGPPPPACG